MNTNTSLKEDLKKNINDLKSIKTSYKQIPNLLTTFRAVAPIPINVLFFSGNIIGALIVSGFAFLTDAFDGPIARHLKVQSQFGAYLDAVCDKLLIGGIALPIVIQNPIMLINIVLEALISMTNIKAKLNGKTPKSSMAGKVKTWVLSLTVLAGYFTSLFSVNIPLLVSTLAITPAVAFQIKTFTGYHKTNNKQEIASNDIDNQIKKVNNEQNDELENNNQPSKTNSQASIEELRQLKQTLIVPNNESKKQKINRIKFK